MRSSNKAYRTQGAEKRNPLERVPKTRKRRLANRPLDEIPEEASMQSSEGASSGKVRILYEQREEAESEHSVAVPPAEGEQASKEDHEAVYRELIERTIALKGEL